MITISNLSNKKDTNTFMFSDLLLDFQTTKKSTNKQNNDVVSGNDLVIATDEGAIFNSIRNLLIQKRYLRPDIKSDLYRYIGLPVSEMGGNAIGEEIERTLTRYEPRVKIKQILVVANSKNNSYTIFMFLILPNFKNKQVSLTGVFDNNGNFDFINAN